MTEEMRPGRQHLKEEMTARLEAKTETNNEKFEVLRSTFISRMDIHLARTESAQEEMLAKMEAHHERMMDRVDSPSHRKWRPV
jgi:hypothetical protein